MGNLFYTNKLVAIVQCNDCGQTAYCTGTLTERWNSDVENEVPCIDVDRLPSGWAQLSIDRFRCSGCSKAEKLGHSLAKVQSKLKTRK